MHHGVQVHQEDDAAALGAVDLVQKTLQHGCDRVGDQVGGQFLLEVGFVAERELFSLRLQEEVEGVVHRHFDHQIDRDLELGGLLGKHQARLVVGKRVLLPVDKMGAGFDLERIGNHLAAAVGRRTQADHLGAKVDKPVVGVVGDVVERGVDRHRLTLEC